jgi:hypothetical protein
MFRKSESQPTPFFLKAQGPQGCSQGVVERPSNPGEIQFAEDSRHFLDIGPGRLPKTNF